MHRMAETHETYKTCVNHFKLLQLLSNIQLLLEDFGVNSVIEYLDDHLKDPTYRFKKQVNLQISPKFCFCFKSMLAFLMINVTDKHQSRKSRVQKASSDLLICPYLSIRVILLLAVIEHFLLG